MTWGNLLLTKCLENDCVKKEFRCVASLGKRFKQIQSNMQSTALLLLKLGRLYYRGTLCTNPLFLKDNYRTLGRNYKILVHWKGLPQARSNAYPPLPQGNWDLLFWQGAPIKPFREPPITILSTRFQVLLPPTGFASEFSSRSGAGTMIGGYRGTLQRLPRGTVSATLHQKSDLHFGYNWSRPTSGSGWEPTRGPR